MDTKAYFDCAASTPVDGAILKEMEPYFTENFGNPGSLHFLGQKSQAAVDSARKKIADLFKVDFSGVLFFSSATEVNNFVIQGIVNRIMNNELRIANDNGSESSTRDSSFSIPHLIISRVEHDSVLKPVEYLEKSGLVEISYLGVDKNGLVKPDQLKKLLKKETVLVSVMLVNNETGAIQPVKEVAKIIKEFRTEKLRFQNQSKFKPQDLQYPIFHSDAVQGLGHLPLKDLVLADLGVDLMTFSGHKIYGPKGIGVLVSNTLGLSGIFEPLIKGGTQEFGFRAGTENVPAIIGFAKAASDAAKARELALSKKVSLESWKSEIIKKAKTVYPKTVVNSPENQSIPEIINLSFPGLFSEELVYRFDSLGIAVSAGSACEAKALQASHVLSAMGLSKDIVGSAVRISFGRNTKKSELDYLLQSFEKVLK